MELEFKYYKFGSIDSIDIDVLIDHPLASGTERDQSMVKEIKCDFPMTKDWDINIIKIVDGVVSKSIPSKGTPDGVHNSLYETFDFHNQTYPFPLTKKIDRDIPSAIEKMLSSVFTFYKNTKHHDSIYKKIPKKVKNGKAEMNERLCYLNKIDFTLLPYDPDYKNINAFKSIAFHIGQTISLLKGVEIYTKQKHIKHHPNLASFINRESLHGTEFLNEALSELIGLMKKNPDIAMLEREDFKGNSLVD